jgi:hypothetical protein
VGHARSDKKTIQASLPHVFFGGDAAFGPKNIITAVAHGHEAARVDRPLPALASRRRRPPPHVNLMSQKMGIHEWSYDNAPTERPALQGAVDGARRRWPASRSRSSWASTPPPRSRKRSAA